MKGLASFYTTLGLTFDYHRHGNSPYHYSATIGQTVLEIYPLHKNQTETDKELRLGFSIDNFDDVIQLLRANNITFISEPMQDEYGYIAIITDPDGRKIELYKTDV